MASFLWCTVSTSMFLSDLLVINNKKPQQGKSEIIRHCTNMNKRIFSLLIAKAINFCIIAQGNSIFDIIILSRGCLTKLENYGNSRGWGEGLTSTPFSGKWGVQSKSALCGGYGYFLELLIIIWLILYKDQVFCLLQKTLTFTCS